MTDNTSAGSPPALPRILVVDHFDSYTLNLLCLLSALAPHPDDVARRVVVLPHTHPLLSSQESFRQHLLPHFDALILSPGPGSPDREADFGFGLEYLRNAAAYNLPTLGVCLGHQGIATAFGGMVRRAKSIQHGTQSSLLYPSGAKEGPTDGLFANVPSNTRVTRYNSLTVEASSLPSCLAITAYADDPLNAGVQRPEVSDLMRSRAASPTTVASSERCVLGLRHKELPLWGVQFHPESIESECGVVMMRNFLKLAREVRRGADVASSSKMEVPASILAEGARYVAAAQPAPEAGVNGDGTGQHEKRFRVVSYDLDVPPLATQDRTEEVFERIFRQGGGDKGPSVWLDSARAGDPQSNFSYMASPSCSVSHRSGSREVEIYSPISGGREKLALPDGQDFWQLMHDAQQELQRLTSFEQGVPSANVFRGGFVGYWGYEMGIDSLGLQGEETISSSADATTTTVPASEFGFCPAVLQLDHATGRWRGSILERLPGVDNDSFAPHSPLLQTLQASQPLGLSPAESRSWAAHVRSQLSAVASSSHTSLSSRADLASMISPLRPVDTPQDYKLKVEAARALIAQGESYELCLTTQFKGRLNKAPQSSSSVDHFDVYRALRAKNSAPYAAYMELAPSRNDDDGPRRRTILSTSPERFLSRTHSGLVEMKPIKGTLPRAGHTPTDMATLSSLPSAAARSAWLAEQDLHRRSALQADQKERAENLMIVDLIRADLLSFCQPSTVHVPKLMSVESYESVHQLVTTVRGQVVGSGSGDGEGGGGGIGPVEALRRCFPPGSMTGAPKRRSVTLLQRLEGKSRSRSERAKGTVEPPIVETASVPSSPASPPPTWHTTHRPRGVYSGALGWIGIDGATDFSVVIRTAVLDGDEVSVGAGGAITYLSDKDREWQEVLDKVGALCVVDVGEEEEEEVVGGDEV